MFTFRVDGRLLRAKLDVVSQTLGKGAVLKTAPHLAGYSLEISADGTLRISTSNGHQFADAMLSVADLTGATAGLPLRLLVGAQLRKLRPLFDGEWVTVAATSGALTLTVQDQAIPVRLLGSQAFPLVPQAHSGTVAELDASALVRALDFLAPAISRHREENSFAEYRDGVFTAGNSSVLSQSYADLGPQCLKIPGSAIGPLKKFLRGLDNVAVVETDEHLVFRRDSDRFGFGKVSLSLRTLKVDPSQLDEPEHFSLELQPLSKAMSRLGIVIDKTRCKFAMFTIEESDHGTSMLGRVRTATGGDSVSARLPIVRHRQGLDGVKVLVTFADLFAALKVLRTETVDIYIQPGKWLKLVTINEMSERSIAMMEIGG